MQVEVPLIETWLSLPNSLLDVRIGSVVEDTAAANGVSEMVAKMEEDREP